MEPKLKPLSVIEEVNQQWIEKMLSLKFGIPVTIHSWSYRLPSGREGFLSEIGFLKVLYSGIDGHRTDLQLVLKVLPKDPMIKQFMANGGLAKREVEFYRFINTKEFQDICSKSGIMLPVPEMYFAAYTEEAITIVLQDLSVDKYKSVIVKEGSNLLQTKVALQAVAQIHAAGLIYINKYGEANHNLATLGSEFNTDFYDQFLIPNLNVLVKMTEGTPLSESVKSLIPKAKSIYNLPKIYPLIKTVIHGDLWSGQLLYTDDESKASTIDWQFCRVDNPVTDVLSMFFMSCDPVVLENHLEELLNSYWMSLTKPLQSLGITLDVTFEHFKTNVENLWLFGFVFLVISIHDFIGGDNISNERILGAINFLEKKGVFSNFVKMTENKEDTNS